MCNIQRNNNISRYPDSYCTFYYCIDLIVYMRLLLGQVAKLILIVMVTECAVRNHISVFAMKVSRDQVASCPVRSYTFIRMHTNNTRFFLNSTRLFM